jgi:hypothetical protein
VLLLGDVRAVQGVADVRVGDRLPLDPDLLVRDRHGLGDLLLDDVLAQPGPAGLDPLGADPQLLLRAGHRVVGGRAGGVVAHGAVPVGVPVGAHVAGGGLGVPGGGVGLAVEAVADAVVAVQLGLLLGGEVALLGLDPGSVLDPGLLVGHPQAVAHQLGLGQGHEALLGAEQAGADRRPLRAAGLVVEVDLADLAELAAVAVDGVGADDALDVLGRDHAGALRWVDCRWWAARLRAALCRRLGAPPFTV